VVLLDCAFIMVCAIEFSTKDPTKFAPSPAPDYVVLVFLTIIVWSTRNAAKQQYWQCIAFYSILTASLQTVNTLWTRRVFTKHMLDDEEQLLLPHESKNAIQIPQLIEEANRSNWAVNPLDVKCIRKIGSGGFGVRAAAAAAAAAAVVCLSRIATYTWCTCRKFGMASGVVPRLQSSVCTVSSLRNR
jgi:hypothetical protein